MEETKNEQNSLESTTQESNSTNGMFCPSCGSRISEGSSFCSHCGAKLTTDDNGGLRTISETKKHSSGIVAWIIAIVAVIALLCTIAFSAVANRDRNSDSLNNVEANATTSESTTVSEETTTAPVTTTTAEKTTQATTTTAETTTKATTKSTTKATTTTEETTTKATTKTTTATTKATTVTTEAEPEIEVLAEYTYSDGWWYTYHFYVVKNNSNKTLKISTSTIAYSSDGSMIALDDASFDALGPGCVSVFYEAFDTEENIGYYDTTWKISESSYKSVIQDLSYVQNDISGGAIFQVTNNGSYTAEFVEGYTLFFSNGELVGFNSTYFTDDDYEIKPGDTISKQVTTSRDFDTMEFYLDGRHWGN